MCLPRVCSLALSILINVPLAGFAISLQSGSWGLKLFAAPFIASPVSAMVLFCGTRGSCVSRTALFVLLCSLVVKLVGAVFAALGVAATSNSDAPGGLGGLGALVYGFLAVLFGVSAASDLILFCVEVYATPRQRERRELVKSNDFFYPHCGKKPHSGVAGNSLCAQYAVAQMARRSMLSGTVFTLSACFLYRGFEHMWFDAWTHTR